MSNQIIFQTRDQTHIDIFKIIHFRDYVRRGDCVKPVVCWGNALKTGDFPIRLAVFLFWVSFILCVPATQVLALSPDQVLVLANKNTRASVGLARYYMAQRGIPAKNLLELRVTEKESCSREDYEGKVVPRVRDYLRKNDPLGKIRCLVTVFGLPLKIMPPTMRREEKERMAGLKERRKALTRQLRALAPEEKEEWDRLGKESQALAKQIHILAKSNQRSSFDSELTLVRVEGYPLEGWIPNPYFVGFRKRKLHFGKDRVMMVSRLDGPSEKIVRRIIRDSIQAERHGLKGTAYFDARWPKSDEAKVNKMGTGYWFYDRSIQLGAERVQKSGRMKVVVNDKTELFQAGDCPDAALYCGWYSLGHYVDAFDWQPGAVGYHIASSECATLKEKKSRVWCKMMLEDGVSATIGPVYEPYVQAFPVPEVFFGLLVEGRLTLAECYALSLPFLSWQMVLVGDPLYRPFARGN